MVHVFVGEATAVPADALMLFRSTRLSVETPIDSHIKELGGGHYYLQLTTLKNRGGFMNGDVLIAEGRRTPSVHFDSLIFVGDNLERPLSVETLLSNALTKASLADMKSVSLPLPRRQSIADLHALNQLLDSLRSALTLHARKDAVLQVTIVIDPQDPFLSVIQTAFT